MEQQKKEKKKVVMPYGLRNKLMAAVAMLLVSSIMMVSSTFAWFTLSTAPEIKGISTSVGANGNLEMALLTSGDADAKIEDTFKDLTKITSAVGDSSAANKDITKANITWGNLVQLSETEKDPYGLSKIQLMPARLQTTDGKTLTVGSPLLTPKYGTDGRVATVDGRTIFSADYTEAGDFEFKENSLTYGVRAVGESATLTPQAKGLMSAKADYTTHLNEARSTVQTSLKTNMQGLANAALALVKDSRTTFTKESNEAKAITALLTDMSTALDKIDMAYGDVVRALVASQVKDAATYNAVMNVLKDAKYSDMVNESGNLKVPTGKTPDAGVTLPTVSLSGTAVATAAGVLAQQKGNVKNAQDAITGDSPNYSTAVNALANTECMDINGLSLKRPTKDDEMDGTVWTKDDNGNYKVDEGALAGSVLSKGVTINMADGSGLFAYIAMVNTNYSASDYIEMSFAGLTVKKDKDGNGGVLVTMNTTVKTFDTTATKQISDMTAAAATDATIYITDTYGYIIDLAFRTNASGSHLKLATDGMQRIYNGTGEDASTNTETMGAGSTMTFTSAKVNGEDVMSDAEIMNLMKAIRVVFFDPGDGTGNNGGTIYGFASLDDIKVDGDKGVTGKLTLKDATVGENGVMTLADKTGADKDKLMELTQNTAARMSVLVYLDGDKVDNSMVANAEQSITGSLNLQFASNADLKPMQNSALKNGTTTTTNTP